MEELKLIVEALGSLGGEAKAAFIFWICARYAFYYLIWGVCLLLTLYTIYRVTIASLVTIGFTGQVKRLMGYREAGIDSKHRNEVFEIIRKYKDKEEEGSP